MARVLVTGATGFIGTHLVRGLVAGGDQVRCLLRRPGQQQAFAPLEVENAAGDIALPATLPPALRDIEVVYHLAGVNQPIQRKAYQQVNAEGARHLAEACTRQPQPPVLVYVSSLAAAGPARDGQPLQESAPPHPVSAYGRSKLAAEHNLRALADRLSITVLRPPSVFGPGDPYVVRLFRLVRRGVNLVPGFRNFHLSWVYVGDLVEAMVLAAEQGQRLAPDREGPRQEQGLYYVALDEQPTVVELAALAAEVQDCRAPRTIHMPPLACRLAASFNDLRTRLLGQTYLLNSDKIQEMLAGSWICSPDKIRRELGFSCRMGLKEGFALTARWYQEQGWL